MSLENSPNSRNAKVAANSKTAQNTKNVLTESEALKRAIDKKCLREAEFNKLVFRLADTSLSAQKKEETRLELLAMIEAYLTSTNIAHEPIRLTSLNATVLQSVMRKVIFDRNAAESVLRSRIKRLGFSASQTDELFESTVSKMEFSELIDISRGARLVSFDALVRRTAKKEKIQAGEEETVKAHI